MSSTFYACILRQYFGGKNYKAGNVTKEKLIKALSYEKLAHKMLIN